MKKTTSTRKVLPKKQVSIKPLIIAGLGIFLAGGAFAFASGDVNGAGSILAAVMSALSNGSTLVVQLGQNTPSGTIGTNQNESIAEFAVNSSGEKQWVTMNTLQTQFVLGGAAASLASLTNIKAQYTYCIPKGVTYGYGWTDAVKNGSCGTLRLDPVPGSVHKNGNTYTADFYTKGLPVYPQQSSGVITLLATPSYTATTTKYATLRADITNIDARGTSCRTITYGLTVKGKVVNYGYSKCQPIAANTVFTTHSGKTVTLKNPYGYGYTTPTPLNTYKGYLNGNLFITTNNISEANALANCKLNAKNNPTASIRCTWGTKEIYNSGPVGSAVAVTKGATSVSTSTVSTNHITMYSTLFTVTAAGTDMYIGKNVTRLASASTNPTAIGGGTSWATLGSTDGMTISAVVSGTGTGTGDTSTAYRIAAGTTRNFTFNVAVSGSHTYTAGIILKALNYANTSTLGSQYVYF